MYTAGLTGYLPLDLVIENGDNTAIIKCTMMQLAQQCTLGNHTELYVSWCGGESWVVQRVLRAYIHDVALLL